MSRKTAGGKGKVVGSAGGTRGRSGRQYAPVPEGERRSNSFADVKRQLNWFLEDRGIRQQRGYVPVEGGEA